MTAAAQPPSDPADVPFADASPAQVRAALTTEDAAESYRQWQEVMARATRELDLGKVLETLAMWRRAAWATAAVGSQQYRAIMASVRHRLATGERQPGAVSWGQLKAQLGLPG